MVSPVVHRGRTRNRSRRSATSKRISAVRVVDGAGKLVGIVTEADLMHRVEAGTQHPYSWWLHFFLGDRAIAADSCKYPPDCRKHSAQARNKPSRCSYP